MVRSPSHVESEVGVDELISDNENVRKRRQRAARRQRAQRPKQGFFRTLVQVIGELLITCGIILLLFVVWELWWTNIEANSAQQAAVSEFSQDFQGPVVPPAPDAPTDFGPPKVMAAPELPSTVFGIAY
ncbi:MAG: class E sortase, partial [Specibacter sp.]